MNGDDTRARQLFEIIAMRKELEKKEKDLKDYFRQKLMLTDACNVGEYVVTSSERERTDIDRDGLKLLLGESLRAYEKKTKYSIIDVKRRN